MSNTIKNIKKVYQYGKKYKKDLFWLVFCSISGIIVGIIVPLLSAKQIVYLTSNALEQALYISLVILLVGCYTYFVKCFGWSRPAHHFSKMTTKNIQLALGKEILKIRQPDMDKNSSGMFIQRITNDTEKVSSFFYEALDSLRNLLSNVGALFATLFIDWRVFLYYLFVSIVLSTLHIIKTKKYGKKDAEYHNKSENVSSLISELVRGEKDIKMLNSQDSFMVALEENIEAQNQKRLEMQRLKSGYNYVISTLTTVFEFVLIVLLMFLISNGSLTIPLAIALFSYKSGIMTVIMEKLSTLLELLKTFDNSCDRVFSILENKTFQKELFGTEHLDEVNGNFEFKNVSFGYNENGLVLDNINFKINSGEMVGFVGKSGSRKNYDFQFVMQAI